MEKQCRSRWQWRLEGLEDWHQGAGHGAQAHSGSCSGPLSCVVVLVGMGRDIGAAAIEGVRSGIVQPSAEGIKFIQ